MTNDNEAREFPHVLGKLYQFKVVAAELEHVAHRFKTFFVPVEAICLRGEPGPVCQARAYITDWHIDRNSRTERDSTGYARANPDPRVSKVVHYDTLRQSKDFRGSYEYPQVFLAEVWSDNGSDGHTVYRLIGYRFVTEPSFAEKLDWGGRTGLASVLKSDLPRCMTNEHDGYLDEDSLSDD